MNNLILLASLSLSIYISALILNKKSLSIKSNRNVEIDTLRGILAMTVFSHHFALTYHWKKTGLWGISDNAVISNLGSVSVSMFFLITGYLFFGKIVNFKHIDWQKFSIERIRRIFPAYLFVMMLVYITFLIESNSHINAALIVKSIFSSALFITTPLGNYDLAKLTSGVQWTLVYEAIFYLSLPICYLIFHNKVNIKSILMVAISALLIGCYSKMTYLYDQLFYLFAFGGVSYFALRSELIKSICQNKYCSVVVILMISFTIIKTQYWTLEQMIFCFICFTAIAGGCNIFGILQLSGLRKMGDISYSIYLSHGLILYYLFSFKGGISISNIKESLYYLLLPLVSIPVTFISKLLHEKIERRYMIQNRVNK
ncbi:acyltransferase family protein [Enterobacter asburiae]|uniref:acyltransferase family protein n=1 Tax=Enterobacter asburiae TaxID=61645 RepID=UPI0022352F3C|nr:acyltransferase [Enterobacter asburiae]